MGVLEYPLSVTLFSYFFAVPSKFSNLHALQYHFTGGSIELSIWSYIFYTKICIFFALNIAKRKCEFFCYRCAVCLAEYHGEDTLRILPYCGHSFHATCIDIWLHQHSTCPVCRVSLRELPERKRLMQPIFSSAIRSHYGIESFDTHSYNYLSGHGFSSRTVGNRGMDSVPEDHCASDDDITDSGGNISPTTEGNQTTKDLGNKHVESPSNP